MGYNNSARRVAVSAVAAAVLALTACSTGASSSGATGDGGGLPAAASPQDVIKDTVASLKGKKVRMIVYTDDAALTQSWISRIRLSFAGTGVEFKYSSANWDSKVLAQQVQTAIDQKVDALILHNADLTVLSNLIQKAQQQGIYVIVMNLGSNTQSDAFIGPNWDDMAAKLANRAADDCESAGKNEVAIISGYGSDTGSVLVEEAATRTFEDRGMQVVATQPGQYDPTKAGDIARTIIQQHPDLCAILGNWDGMMLGVAKVVGDMGVAGDVGVYTTDSSQDACDAIKDGTLTAAVNYQAGTGMGDSAAAVLKYLLQSGVQAGASRTAVFTGTTVIDRSNYTQPDACYGTPVDWGN